ncbi:L-type lectin-domain containing receptor kinase IV.1-like [Dorcoceras hygrometricum]|uniref:L-type lectin-domain containing receptor kinase IV.1-like n=1 Tax=Dorcoceras hygrometricum TaxID=472368 RepID=A0A2Z7ANY2_9LAMI|nr:L-type lectin-domain containing receptor kinase IV.1-like [Dorcoceras hygrometricum]
MGSLATLDLPMVVDLIGICGLKGPYCTLTTTDWFLQALSVIPRGSWGDVARRFTMAEEGVSVPVVDRIGDIYRSLPRRADVIVTTVGARHKCQQGFYSMFFRCLAGGRIRIPNTKVMPLVITLAYGGQLSLKYPFTYNGHLGSRWPHQLTMVTSAYGAQFSLWCLLQLTMSTSAYGVHSSLWCPLQLTQNSLRLKQGGNSLLLNQGEEQMISIHFTGHSLRPKLMESSLRPQYSLRDTAYDTSLLESSLRPHYSLRDTAYDPSLLNPSYDHNTVYETQLMTQAYRIQLMISIQFMRHSLRPKLIESSLRSQYSLQDKTMTPT